MKSYELKATKENLLNTFLDDSIGRDADVIRFAKILNAIDDSCSISLDGGWGSGKTFFVKQTKLLLDAFNNTLSSRDLDEVKKIVEKCNRFDRNFDIQPQVAVYYDAWKNDNDDDPVLSLVYTIVQSMNVDNTIKGSLGFIKIAASIIEIFTNKDWNKVIESFKGDDPLLKIKASKDIEDLIKEFLDELLSERGNRLVVFIDELDRCKPSYAVKLLERMKHYFDNERITFVFSINSNELQQTIRQYYGSDFDACRYLDRFFDLRISLPPVNMKQYFCSIGYDSTTYTYDIVCDAVIRSFHFELREIARYIRLSKIASNKIVYSNSRYVYPSERGTQFCILFFVPIMLGLKIADSQRYAEFINGKDCSPLIEVMSICNLGIRFYENLLSPKESFEKEQGKDTVTLAQKMKELYDSVFVKTQNVESFELVNCSDVGKYSFTQKTRNDLLRIVSLLSEYANTNFE
ncbi:MAG: hypothetical protein LIO51_07525 [Clostridiales bacterium]|nr:hypothetical protein [Clostridiales bacterium]